MDALKLTLFGSPQVEHNGVVLQWRTRKALALLVYLAVNTQPQSRETLAALFWPEFSSGRAFANLREALRCLKQQLSEHWLDIRRQEIRLKTNSTLQIDILEFQQYLDQTTAHAHLSDIICTDCLPPLLAAIDLYRNDFLRGFTLPDSPAFDEWQFFQADLLKENLIEGRKKVIRYYASHNDFHQAIEHARRWVAQSLWSEAAHRELMRLYALNHQRSAALQQYRECVRMLREEFQADPEKETRALYESILHQSPDINARPESSSRFKPAISDNQDASASLNFQPGASAPGEQPPLHNLPAQTTTFIGRSGEIAAVKDLLLLPNVRLLTLTGAGGSGKTRLSLQLAAEVLKEFRDGVFFVSLAPISNPELMAATIVHTLGLHIVGNTPALNLLKGYLRQKQLLLILDNFEQLISASSLLIDLLAAAPDLNILVTSRTVLRLSAEQEYIVPPLQVPDVNALPSFARLKQSEAVQLFVERAKTVSSDFTFTEDNALTVAEICTRLDGLPLAIELAAARVKLLPPHAMLTRLDSPLRFLTGGARDLPDRQQTLRKTIEWSYHLLNQEETVLFRRLAVFVGGWTLEAAETICVMHGDVDVLLVMESLIDHNLLVQDTSKGGSRFTMLETIREYALERFMESDETEVIQKRHAQFFVESAKEAHTHLNKTPIEEHMLWKERLTLDMDNLRAALVWAIVNAEEWRQTAIHLYEILGDLLELTGQHVDARKVYQGTLREVPEDDVIWQARLYRKIGKSWEVQGNFPEALRTYVSAESVLERKTIALQPKHWQEWTEIQVDRLWMYYWQNELDEMTDLVKKAQPIVDQYGTPAQRARFFHGLTLLGYKQERYMLSEKTESYALSAVSASQDSSDLNVINMSQFHLGFSYLWADKLDDAEKPLHTALNLSEQIGDVVLQSRCLTYLTILYRRREQTALVKSYIPRCLKVANIAQLPEYSGTAKANLAWMAWHAEDLSETESNSRAALESWQQLSFVYPFQWTALWPLIGVTLAQDQISEAVEYARVLLDPGQKRLPDVLTGGLKNLIKSWDEGELEAVRIHLDRVMTLAHELGYI